MISIVVEAIEVSLVAYAVPPSALEPHSAVSMPSIIVAIFGGELVATGRRS
jgi:hypothetical protein